MLMQQTITNLLLTVHALTVIQQWIQQLVKSQMKVGMRLTPDGTPRTKNAYYGAAATIFKGEPMDFIAGGNNLNVPTAYWFATDSSVIVPELPEEPNKPVLPNTVSAKVTYHKNFVSVEETTENQNLKYQQLQQNQLQVNL